MALERLLCLVGLRPPVDGAAILEMVAVEHPLRVAGLDQAVAAPRHARVIVHHFLVDTPANQLPRRYPLPEQVQRPLRRDFARTPLVITVTVSMRVTSFSGRRRADRSGRTAFSMLLGWLAHTRIIEPLRSIGARTGCATSYCRLCCCHRPAPLCRSGPVRSRLPVRTRFCGVTGNAPRRRRQLRRRRAAQPGQR